MYVRIYAAPGALSAGCTSPVVTFRAFPYPLRDCILLSDFILSKILSFWRYVLLQIISF